MTQIQIKGDFGSGQSVSMEVAREATRRVAQNALDKDDALLILDMLGLIDPLPGNEIVIAEKERLTEGRKQERALRRKQRREELDRRIAELEILPHEVGE